MWPEVIVPQRPVVAAAAVARKPAGARVAPAARAAARARDRRVNHFGLHVDEDGARGPALGRAERRLAEKGARRRRVGGADGRRKSVEEAASQLVAALADLQRNYRHARMAFFGSLASGHRRIRQRSLAEERGKGICGVFWGVCSVACVRESLWT
jgi:chemotaxis protein histidine kinase CheA